MNEDHPEQEALFYIEGPDERGCVKMDGANSDDPWTVLSQWPGSVDFDEVDARR